MNRRPAPPFPPRRLLATVLAVCAALWCTAVHAVAAPASPGDGQISWGAAPADTQAGQGRSRFVYTLAPGSRVTDALSVVNRGDRAIRLRVYASDAFTTPSGGLDLLAGDKKPRDVGSWVTLKSTTLTLKSQQSATVPFTLTVPADATPGDHSGGVVTSLVTKSGDGTVRLDRRLGARLYLQVAGPLKPSLTVSRLHAGYDGTFDPLGGGSLRLTYTVANTGNVRLKARQVVETRGLFGLIKQTAPIGDLPELLPGGSLTRTVTVKGVWPAVRLDAGLVLRPVASDGEDAPVRAAPVTARESLWAWPWGQLAAVAALVVLAGGYVFLRRRRKRKMDRAVSAAVAKALGAAREAAPETGLETGSNAGPNAKPDASSGTEPDTSRD
ncbi:WxL protein peptidoglycan domain-containing protein [Streptomyces sp. NPDC005435]|uniref:WxL protein peptidoglycan domain-containing protein n=1 Tax=Streptomyces sp. NPDC005435 TaxID=3154464 RepID=UPI003456EC8F